MPKAYLSIGSNQNPEFHIQKALDELFLAFGELIISSVYESEAVGFAGDNFYNLVVGIHTDRPLFELNQYLKHLEDQYGRDRSSPKFSGRTLDVDILTYGDCVGTFDGITLPREEIAFHAFVLLPMVDVAAKDGHPSLGLSYQALWQSFNKDTQKLWPVDFVWQGKLISNKKASS
ncbi:2-amino-4-hydroxy-6-hydroxymethyldihydropteridine diphosphokinase [Marinibactrum halimedae]|uniref:2-amino-4-hydroxy-6-hydroxymethyldihydropteridine diphosphokinase n=1 Tax=Marinibactrum halimedae TaxID=1444977 RepID=A0AA37T516_9GAMM|nr:2-amino-4-hydroxy-6-hydroxymethyldihydropteridine diphosphokinase [Marinibactrum halimedae]MCD9459547.1 2-amino-4-hydroxy-6-hydroxymethyldihydropteridine diphosphokinase [Marinibactrum halimedae]GLS25636.1 2-amino-4-hydroxy-6-hydroxymethyldihydropteridine diphosphokinase [Marinibactrum halimedae]